MIAFFGILVALVLIVFGVGYAIDSAAHAKEAQAAIEASRATQVLAVNQLANTVILSLMLIVLLVVIVGLVWALLRYQSTARRLPRYQIGVDPANGRDTTQALLAKRSEDAQSAVEFYSFHRKMYEDAYQELLSWIEDDNAK